MVEEIKCSWELLLKQIKKICPLEEYRLLHQKIEKCEEVGAEAVDPPREYSMTRSARFCRKSSASCASGTVSARYRAKFEV